MYTEIFSKEALKYEEFSEAKEIVKANSTGNIWLIGGFIFRNIVAGLYGKEKPKIDLDFIVENINEKLDLPKEWVKSQNGFGNYKLIGPKFEIDLVPITNIYSIKYRNLNPSIENYLSGTPLNIQSIVYDIKKETIEGISGIDSIRSKLILPHGDNHLLEFAAKDKETSVENYIKKYAKELGFEYILPEKF